VPWGAALLLGDSRDQLRRELVAAFPGATVVEDQASLEATLAKISLHLDDPGTDPSLRLDLRGSALELAVWTALRAIPVGQTRSYGQLAKALPFPATAQEVGAACAANRLAVLVPCHRVLKADGSISGYRWGVRRKRYLLQKESECTERACGRLALAPRH
jgi:AraC family transcriptional regulator, regulatory protein of adaptative response / methylated-DNA-[protein]-cysteine methyltransferase